MGSLPFRPLGRGSSSPSLARSRDHFAPSIMAFHIACPVTCERICYCELGFGGDRRRRAFEDEARRLDAFVRDPWVVRRPLQPGPEEGAVQILVPRLQAPLPPEDEVEEWPSAQAKRAALQRRAAAASVATEDYVRKLEAGMEAVREDPTGEAAADLAKEDQLSSTTKVICRICFSGENDGSEKAKRMLSCKLCCKKYHKSCVKTWADNRDLFHWSFWTCPSCRICEVCRRTGDPLKFMFCKRCDAAYHCYCLQPPHKNVSHGPYLCPKHTRCHSCGSNVHGSGHSTRWFLGYNFCDACGRLFTKEKYCPVCLKVYRDSESTPMVCCDVCQRWVHCSCDGISDEKYLQFQADRNLYYKCAACRGDCYQIRDMDDAVQELWRRRDKADHELIVHLRDAAGLPTHDDIFSVSPSDEDDDPVKFKIDEGRTLKFSIKGVADKASKNTSEPGKKVTKKVLNKKPMKKVDAQDEELVQNFGKSQARSLESSLGNAEVRLSHHTPVPGTAACVKKSKISLDNSRNLSSINTEGHAISCEVDIDRNRDLCSKEANPRHSGKNETGKGTKLVIHIGGRNRNLASSPLSEASTYQREQEKSLSNGSQPSNLPKESVAEEPALNKRAGAIHFCHEEDAPVDIKYPLLINDDQKFKTDYNDGLQRKALKKSIPDRSPPPKAIIFRRRRTTETQFNTTPLVNDNIPNGANPESATVGSQNKNHDTNNQHSVISSHSKDPRPLLKLKFKNLQLDNQVFPLLSLSSLGGENSIVRGQRSKRKRPSIVTKKVCSQANKNDIDPPKDDGIEGALDDNWILQRLGKNAVGKRVEVKVSDNTWQKGVVCDLVGGNILSVDLDNGKSRTVELGTQGVRLIPHRQKRTKL